MRQYWLRDFLGILPGVLGSLGMLTGIAIYFSYLYVARHTVKTFLIIDSPNHAQYVDWVNGEYGANRADIMLFVANITNVDGILKGLLPTIEYLGPYNYSTVTIKDDIQFRNDSSLVSFNSTTHYLPVDRSSLHAATDVFAAARPSADEDIVIHVNEPIFRALEELHASGVGDDGLPVLFASCSFREVLQFGGASAAAAWASDPNTCFGDVPAAFGACGLAHYYGTQGLGGSGPFALAGEVLALDILRDFTNQTVLLSFMKQGSAVADLGSMPSDSQGFVWGRWEGWGIPKVTLSDVIGLMGYVSFTGSAVMSAMQAAYCVPQSIMFIRRSASNAIFNDNPFMLFLTAGQTSYLTCFFCNGTTLQNVVRTGRDDESFMGMDYYLEMNGVGESVAGRTPGSTVDIPMPLEGRMQSIKPFMYSIPKTADIRVPFIHRRLQYDYIHTVAYEGLKVRRYEYSLRPSLPGDFLGNLGLGLVFGAPMSVSRVGLVGAGWYQHLGDLMGPAITEKVGDAVSVSRLVREPLSYFHAEEVSGFGVNNQIVAQVNFVLNFSVVNGSFWDVPAMDILKAPLDAGSSQGPIAGDGLTIVVPHVIFSQRRYANDVSARFLHHQLHELLDIYSTILIIAVSAGVILLASSMVWVAWDTQGTAVLQEDDYRKRKSE